MIFNLIMDKRNSMYIYIYTVFINFVEIVKSINYIMLFFETNQNYP